MADRAQYTDEQKAMVMAKYPLCKTPEDRDRLAHEAGIGSRQKLYNLASRLGATRAHAGSQVDWSQDDSVYDAVADRSRLYLRDDPERVTWSADDRRYITEHFGKTHIEDIAFMLNRTETAVAYEARKMGLRNVPKYYDVRKVAPWLGIYLSELLLLTKHGLEVYPCTDRNGQLKITLVSTTSLARVLLKGRLWRRLVERFDADRIFIRDVIESIATLQKERAVWEPNPWVSHGHTSLNPFSEACFGLFYDGYDEKMAGSDLEPLDLAPSANVASDSWKRGKNGHADFDDDIEELAPDLSRFNGEEVVSA